VPELVGSGAETSGRIVGMSIAAYLVCPSRRISLLLGKRLRDTDARTFGFSFGEHRSSENPDPQLTAAVWAFLADTAGEQVRVAFSDDLDYDTVAGYTHIERDPDDTGDISLEDYVGDVARRGKAAR
jgi:hypothetical protein